MRPAVFFTAFGLLTTACGSRSVEVDHPFYLMAFDEAAETILVRCPTGTGGGCANDNLPDGAVIEAGASDRYVVVHTIGGYFYFARIETEAGGYGNHPEMILGPLTAEQFEAAKARFGLPEFTTRS